MITAVLPDATRCPDCQSVLDGGPACPSCALPLLGPPARRLWEVDVELLAVDARRHDLLTERTGLLAALRDPGAWSPAHPVAGGTAPVAAAPSGSGPVPRQEWSPQRVQNTLLGLGGLLLAVAALVFAAVTYDRLGAGGRSLVLVTLTLAVAAAAPKALSRGLTATAETLGAVTLVLAALDAYGLRTLGLGESLGGAAYTAASAAVLSAAAAAYAQVVPLRMLRSAAVVLAQLPVPFLLADADAGPGASGLWLAAQAGVDVALLLPALPWARLREVTTTIRAAAVTVGTAALLAGLVACVDGPPTQGALTLTLLAGVLVGAALLTTSLRTLLTAAPVPLLATAALALADAALRREQLPLVPAAVALLAMLGLAQLPRGWRTGPGLGALVVAGAAVAAVAESAVQAVTLPLTWLADPWTAASGASARQLVGLHREWDGTVVTTVVVTVAALVVVAAGLGLDRLRQVAPVAAALAGGAVVLLPLGLDLGFGAGLAVLLAAAATAALGGAWLHRSRPEPGLVLVTAGGSLSLLATGWSSADRTSTLVVLPVVAVLAAVVAALLGGLPAALATGLAGGAATVTLAAVGAANGLAQDQVGGLLLLAVAGSAGAAALLPGLRRHGAETAAGVAAVVAGLLAVGDAGWLSWVLAGTGLVALATALLPDRRRVGAVGGLLLSASSWVRLADADVTAPEPYVLPLAVVALLLGALRRRSQPDTRSWTAYGPGLSLLLLPSLLASFDDETATRALLVGGVALAVVLLGARHRLQAPLALGGAVLAVDAVALLGPYATALPRFVTLGLAGTLLVVVGATYEQRRRDLARLRDRFDALA